jgi:hypothetical protein
MKSAPLMLALLALGTLASISEFLALLPQPRSDDVDITKKASSSSSPSSSSVGESPTPLRRATVAIPTLKADIPTTNGNNYNHHADNLNLPDLCYNQQDRNGNLILLFATAAFLPLLNNLLMSMDRLMVENYLIMVMDVEDNSSDELLSVCRRHSLPCYNAAAAAASPPLDHRVPAAATSHVAAESTTVMNGSSPELTDSAMLDYTFRRLQHVIAVLELGYHVLHLDIDTVMLRDPLPPLVRAAQRQRPPADIAFATDSPRRPNPAIAYFRCHRNVIEFLHFWIAQRAPGENDMNTLQRLTAGNMRAIKRAQKAGRVAQQQQLQQQLENTSVLTSIPAVHLHLVQSDHRLFKTCAQWPSKGRSSVVVMHANCMSGLRSKYVALQRAGLWMLRCNLDYLDLNLNGGGMSSRKKKKANKCYSAVSTRSGSSSSSGSSRWRWRWQSTRHLYYNKQQIRNE